MLLSKKSTAFSEEICTYFKSQYDDFMKYQELALNTLKEVHRVCEKNSIPYYLAFGSLLGIIRDGGQIPWDYDIDILVPFQFHEQLIEALKQDLSSDYHFETRYLDKNCRHYTIRVAPEKYDCAVLHVDIFWLIGESSDPKIQENHFKIRNLFYKCSIYKHPNRRERKMYSRKVMIKRTLKNIKYFLIPDKLLEKKYLDLLEIPLESSEYCTFNAGNMYLFKTEWFGIPQKYSTYEGAVFYIPEDYDSILKSTYGDYLKIPRIENRIREFKRSLDILKKCALLDEN